MGALTDELGAMYVNIVPTTKGIASGIAAGVKSVSNSAASKLSSDVGRSLSKTISQSNIGQNLGSSLQNGASKATAVIGRGLAKVAQGAGSALSASFRASAKVLGDSAAVALKGAAATVGTAVGAAIGASVGGGFSKSINLNTARAKLTGLGYEGEQLTEVMTNALNAVKGTAFGLGDSATAASQLLASGIKPGKELEGVLRNISDSAAIAGVDYGEMSSIFAKVFASGVAQAEELNQIRDRGIAIDKEIAAILGVEVGMVKKLASEGQVTADVFNTALQQAAGGLADTMGRLSIKDSFKNVLSGLSNLTEPYWTKLFAGVTPALVTLKDKLGEFSKSSQETFAPFMDGIGKATDKLNTFVGELDLQAALDKIKAKLEDFQAYLLPLGGLAVGAISKSLSGIPIIGGIFGGLTGPVGLVLGLFANLLRESEPLRESLLNLGGAAQDFFGNVFGGLGTSGADSFSSFFQTAGDSVSTFVDSVTALLGNGNFQQNITDALGTIGESAGTLIGSIGGFIGEILGSFGAGGMSENPGEFLVVIADKIAAGMDILSGLLSGEALQTGIGDTIKGIVGAISDIFKNIDFEALSNTIGTVFDVVGAAVGVIGSIIESIIGVIQSEPVQNFFASISEFAGKSEENAQLVGAIGLAIAGIIGGLSLLGKGKGKAPDFKFLVNFSKALVDIAKNGLKALPGIASSMGAAGMALVKAAPGILAGIAAVSGIVMAIAAIGLLAGELNLNAGIGYLVETLKILVAGLVDMLVDVAGGIGDIVSNVVMGIVQTISTAAVMIAAAFAQSFELLTPALEGIKTFIEGVASVINDVVNTSIIPLMGSFGGMVEQIGNAIAETVMGFTIGTVLLIDKLASDGEAAGKAALALAAGLLALSGAMAGQAIAGGIGKGISAIGEGLGGAKDFIGGIFGKEKKQGKKEEGSSWLSTLLGDLQNITAYLEPASKAIEAFMQGAKNNSDLMKTIGASMLTNLANGFVSQYQLLVNILSKMLVDLQSVLNSRPLQVQIGTPKFEPGPGFGGGYPGGGGGPSNTITQNIDVRTNDPEAVVKRIGGAYKLHMR